MTAQDYYKNNLYCTVSTVCHFESAKLDFLEQF
jgi:hypothetical protein